MWRRITGATLGVLLGGILCGQGVLRMKNGVSPEESRRPIRHTVEHWIIEAGPETPSNLEELLESRGALLVRHVPDDGWIIRMPWSTDLSDLHLRQMRVMRPSEKLSSSVQRGGEADVVVEFHPDVTDADARRVIAMRKLVIRENPDLLPGHLLVHGGTRAIGLLAEDDEVAYVFPASDDLVSGRPVAGCPGALTDAGTVGQYIATYGDGWDGPGRGSASVNYAYARLTEKLPRETVTSVIDNVMAEWARYASVTFTYSDKPAGARTLSFLFASGAHGDGFPFDGPGKVLAHTYYPAPANPEPIAGDLHFDDDEHWAMGADIDLFSVVLHEMGHALGLGHADRPGAVMYPYYSRVTRLAADDINAIQQLYAAPGAGSPTALPLKLTVNAPATTTAAAIAISGTTTGGSGEVQVRWKTDTGASGTATGVRDWSIPWIPLATGRNVVTVTATDAQSNSVSQPATINRTDAAPPAGIQVAITAPGSSTVAAADVTISGTATAPAGIARVQWSNSRGGAGDASGTETWTARLTLQPGQNIITITATGLAGGQGVANLTLNYAKTSSTDTTAPTLAITSPVGSTIATSSASIRFAGTSKDNVGVTEVTWATSTGGSGTAQGTANWVADVPLLVGTNTVTVRAKDAAGNSGWRSVVVTRR